MDKAKNTATQEVIPDIKSIRHHYWLNIAIFNILLAVMAISIFGFGPTGIAKKFVAFGVYFIIYIALMAWNRRSRDEEKTWIERSQPIKPQRIPRTPSQTAPTRPSGLGSERKKEDNDAR